MLPLWPRSEEISTLFAPSSFDRLRDVLGVDLRPMGEEGQRRVGAGKELQEAHLDHRAHLGNLLRLRHGQAGNVGRSHA